MGEEVLIGLDVGGTTAKGLAVDREGRVVASATAHTGSGPHSLDSVLDLASRLQARAARRGHRIAGLGACAPGVLDPGGRCIEFASNLAWRDVPLADLLAGRVEARAMLANDATAAGLAEWQLGAARGVDNLAHLVIGTGIGASLVVDGRMLSGRRHAAGELGHVAVFPDGEQCPCGRKGCLDTYAGARGMMERYARLGGTRARDVAELASVLHDDPVAAAVWELATEGLARAIGTVAMALDVELVVLGGGVAGAGEALLGPVREKLRDQLVWKPPPVIVQTALGARAGVLGALVVAHEGLGETAGSWRLDAVASAAAT